MIRVPQNLEEKNPSLFFFTKFTCPPAFTQSIRPNHAHSTAKEGKTYLELMALFRSRRTSGI